MMRMAVLYGRQMVGSKEIRQEICRPPQRSTGEGSASNTSPVIFTGEDAAAAGEGAANSAQARILLTEPHNYEPTNDAVRIPQIGAPFSSDG